MDQQQMLVAMLAILLRGRGDVFVSAQDLVSWSDKGQQIHITPNEEKQGYNLRLTPGTVEGEIVGD